MVGQSVGIPRIFSNERKGCWPGSSIGAVMTLIAVYVIFVLERTESELWACVSV